MQLSTLDLFCHVIDNFGDAGVAYRFASEFRQMHPACRIRVFIDKVDVLTGIDQSIDPGLVQQMCRGIEFIDYSTVGADVTESITCADVLVELFGCFTPDWYLEKALFSTPLIINLEYLSAETWGAGYHLKESLLPRGTAKKFFYMPGFTRETGGLLFNSRLAREPGPDEDDRGRQLGSLLEAAGYSPEIAPSTLIGTVFTYERGFDTLIADLNALNCGSLLLCFGTKTRIGMEQTLARYNRATGERAGSVRVVYLPNLPQASYDALLRMADFNFVRGEDSLVQAIAAQKPFIWNAYLQSEQYQQVKVEALCSEFEKYFDDANVFRQYRGLLLSFNDAVTETSEQSTTEHYATFFGDLKKIEHATRKMCYFIRQNCNLVQKFSEFIRDFQETT
jgi:uncharacterized repeat protein (TIGR03837 family)